MNEQLTENIKALIESLYQQGVRHVVVSPGSRTTPIALLLAEFVTHQVADMHLHIAVDERSAGFLGLGIAKTKNEPVVLLATSGTATVNYAPAMAEASSSHVPLIALTTDRPEELQAIGAPQTLHQTNLYGDQTKADVTISVQSTTPDTFAYIVYKTQHLVHLATTAPAGPIQINLPLRKPLMPDLGQAWPEVTPIVFAATNASVHLDDEWLQGPVIFLAGPQEGANYSEQLSQVAQRHYIPVIADVLSQTRPGSTAIVGIDALISAGTIADLPMPKLVVRFGGTPVSAKVLAWLKEHQIQVVQVGTAFSGRDHTRYTDVVVETEAPTFLNAFDQLDFKNNAEFSQAWQDTQKDVARVIANVTDFNDLQVVQAMTQLPADTNLFIANSMPIRDYDNYWQVQNAVHVWANRGANGIDGTISSAVGMALDHENNWLAIGDLAFYHDMNGLMLAKQEKINLTILVTNNDGGGIFSFLPQAAADEYFELLFGTGQGLSIAKVAELYNAKYTLATSQQALVELVKAPSQGLHLIEVQTQRQTNYETHQTVLKELGALHGND